MSFDHSDRIKNNENPENAESLEEAPRETEGRPSSPPDKELPERIASADQDIPDQDLERDESDPGVLKTSPDALNAPRPSCRAFDESEGREAHLAGWKDAMRSDFEAWLATVDKIPEPDIAEPDDHDLYSFFEQLAAMNAEARKANRRTAEAFSRWNDALSAFEGDVRLLREQLARRPAADPESQPLSRRHCLALVELLDRLQRLAKAFSSEPRNRWWDFRNAAWQQAWHTQREAFGILLGHFETLLAQEGLTRIECLDNTFDPAIMAAVAAEPDRQRPDQTVIEEIQPGYYRRGELLRPAQVKVAVTRSGEQK